MPIRTQRKQRSGSVRRSAGTTIGDVTAHLDRFAPPSLAQAWDNVGLLAGDAAEPCRGVLMCIDLSAAVLTEAQAAGANLLVAYHPPIFKPIGRVRRGAGEPGDLVHAALRAGISLYSPHTALDAAPGGTNDVLAELCSLSEIEPFDYVSPPGTQLKCVTFVPADRVDAVAAAMAQAGAGRIGEYSHCSYRLSGQGTFFGSDAAAPKVGRKGRLERVPEVRLEMIVPRPRLPEVVDALIRSHPYEEPAYDLYPLESAPSFGIGRVGALPPRTTLRSLANRLARAVGSKVALTVGPGNAPLRRAAICVGAAGRLPLESPRAADSDLIVTGEIRHHDALLIARLGKCAVALGHWESERPVLPVLARRLAELCPQLTIRVSRRDQGPFAPATPGK